jgi:GntR family transcriptional regulator, rspAB operon transcriptional repressor
MTKPMSVDTLPRTAGKGNGDSLQSLAYERIKHRIITCAYQPGDYLNEQKVCQDLKLGRTPVHQALNQLMLQGLVDVIPRKGVIVKPISLNEILDVAEVRLICETECAGFAAARAKDKDIKRLGRILKQAGKALRSRNVEQLMLLDRDFHGVLAGAAGNPALAGILKTLHERSLRIWFISLNDPEHLDRVHREHESIVAALIRRDVSAAKSAMRKHILSYRQNISRSI